MQLVFDIVAWLHEEFNSHIANPREKKGEAHIKHMYASSTKNQHTYQQTEEKVFLVWTCIRGGTELQWKKGDQVVQWSADIKTISQENYKEINKKIIPLET